jgi:Coenzyme PQQ synthesis protein D (PqqD)
MAELHSVYRRSDSLVTRDLAGEKIIVPVRAKVGDLSSIYTLNAVANDVWLLLDGNHTLADIIRNLEQTYDVEPATLVSDVMRLVDELSGEGLIRTN